MNNNEIEAGVLFVPRSVTVDQIVVHVGVAASSASVGRMGIYAADANGRPSTLIVDAGTYDATSTGTKTITISPAVTLPQGVVFLAHVQQGASFQVRRRGFGSGYPRTTTAAGSVSDTPGLWGYRQSNVTGALPDPFTSSTINSTQLLMAVRIASVI
jgi:hypothetical protein